MDPAEHGRRLVDVLLLADAVPSRPKGEFNAPRMCSVSEPAFVGDEGKSIPTPDGCRFEPADNCQPT